jgi:hypothetical protein
MYKTPVGAGLLTGSNGFSHDDLNSWLGDGFRVVFGWPGAEHSTESLILAQDERWRRA